MQVSVPYMGGAVEGDAEDGVTGGGEGGTRGEAKAILGYKTREIHI